MKKVLQPRGQGLNYPETTVCSTHHKAQLGSMENPFVLLGMRMASSLKDG